MLQEQEQHIHMLAVEIQLLQKQQEMVTHSMVGIQQQQMAHKSSMQMVFCQPTGQQTQLMAKHFTHIGQFLHTQSHM